MRIGAKLPHDLWQETVDTAVYLYNRTPRYANDWQTPYERFYTYLGQQENAGDTAGDTARKPQIAHLKAYGCRAYAMTKDAQLKRKRLLKLDPRAHIGYLVGYDSTNIYRIWIPHQGKVISTRDVIFDEKGHFDGKRENLLDSLIREKDELVKKAIMPEKLATNERIVQEDDDLISLYDSEDTIVVDTGHLDQDSVGQDLYDFICNSSNWPTPPQSDLDDQDDAQHTSFASLLIQGREASETEASRASPKGVAASEAEASQLWPMEAELPHRLDDFKQYKVATK